MIIKKRNVLLVSLVLLLVVVGYLNHQLTEKSMLESSNEYQKYEEGALKDVAIIDEGESLEVDLDIEEDINAALNEIEVIDSTTTEVSYLTEETSQEIAETLSKEENLKNVNYFIEYRLSRDKLRAGLVDRLNEIITNERSSEDMINQAQEEIIRIGEISEKELYLEGMIKAKGFEDVLVFLDVDSARIVVSTNDLTEQDVMQVLEIVSTETAIEASNIKIMKKL